MTLQVVKEYYSKVFYLFRRDLPIVHTMMHLHVQQASAPQKRCKILFFTICFKYFSVKL